MLLSSTDTAIQNYIDKLNEYPIIYIDFGNLSVEFKNFVSRQVVKHGFLPLDLKDLEAQKLILRVILSNLSFLTSI